MKDLKNLAAINGGAVFITDYLNSLEGFSSVLTCFFPSVTAPSRVVSSDIRESRELVSVGMV